MKNNKQKLLYICIPLMMSLSLLGCSTVASDLEIPQSDVTPQSAYLCETEDMGWEYIDSFVFLGESTTYHLKSRGVLSEGTETNQVWAPKNGTVNLDTTVSTLKIRYPETGEEITVEQAVRMKKPKRILLTFGLNGAVTKIKKGETYFKTCYRTLIDCIRRGNDETEIILQSCFPVAKSMDMSSYTVSASTLNEYISVINSWTFSLANELGIGYLNTQEILTDTDGFLKMEYQSGDGYHLTADAYKEILKYIRTHGKVKNI